MPAIASGISTEDNVLATQATPSSSAAMSASRMPTANAVIEVQRIFACFSVGGGNAINNQS